MKKLFYSAAFCAATLLGLAGCSSDPVMPEPVNPAVGIVDGTISPGKVVGLNPRIIGPESIELDQLYTFTATSAHVNDTFTFTVKDTYFNDPSSYAINVSPSGTRINVVFNDYGHYTITARSNRTGKEGSYEVAKYYKDVHFLKYNSTAPTSFEPGKGYVSFTQWFECYRNRNLITMDYSGKITNFNHRIVVLVDQLSLLYMHTWNTGQTCRPDGSLGTIVGIGKKGASRIVLPEERVRVYEKTNAMLGIYGWVVPWCDGNYTLPTERCGAL